VVPIAQHRLVAQARAKNKPVIIATQMLESMIDRPRPTRAEVSDISHAVFSGADAVMLSAETAVGAYPVQAVEMMDRVARHVEGWQWDQGAFRNLSVTDELEPPMPLNIAMARSTAQLSRDLKARTILVLSRTGTTAAMVAGARPGAPIVAATTDAATYRRMNLLWGVLPIQVVPELFKHAHTLARRVALDLGLATEGQQILLVAGFRSDTGESAPMVTVLTV
jgi:pyruvate kinase